MPQSDIRIALRTLDFEKRFPTDPWKINNLIQTVDQEVGGSNPPSCTSRIKDFFWPAKIQGSFGVTPGAGEIVAVGVLAFVRLVPLVASQKPLPLEAGE